MSPLDRLLLEFVHRRGPFRVLVLEVPAANNAPVTAAAGEVGAATPGYSSPVVPWVVAALTTLGAKVERHAIVTQVWMAIGLPDPSGDKAHGSNGRKNLGDAITRCLQELLKVGVVTLTKEKVGKARAETSSWALVPRPTDALPPGPKASPAIAEAIGGGIGPMPPP